MPPRAPRSLDTPRTQFKVRLVALTAQDRRHRPLYCDAGLRLTTLVLESPGRVEETGYCVTRRGDMAGAADLAFPRYGHQVSSPSDEMNEGSGAIGTRARDLRELL